MITPILEKLLLTGRATKFNKVHGYSAAGIIKCPKDRWLIVTSILYYPFFDSALLADPKATIKFNFMNLRMQSKNNLQNYTFKNRSFVPRAGDPNVDSDPVLYDVFDIHKEDIIFQISKNSDIAIAADVQFGNLLPQAQAEQFPAGYGTPVPVIRRVTLTAGGTDYFPQGTDASPDLVPTVRAREDLIFDVNDGNLLQPADNTNIPLINFTVISVTSKALQNN